MGNKLNSQLKNINFPRVTLKKFPYKRIEFLLYWVFIPNLIFNPARHIKFVKRIQAKMDSSEIESLLKFIKFRWLNNKDYVRG